MEQKKTALLLALALAVLCAVPALAEGDPPPDAPPAQTESLEDTPSQADVPTEPTEPEDIENGKAPEPEPAPQTAEPSPQAEPAPQTEPPEEETPPTTYTGTDIWGSPVDDELAFTGDTDFRSLRFGDLRDRVLEGSLTALMLEESIASIDAINYNTMYIDLANQLGSIQQMQNMYASIPVTSTFEGMMQGYVISSLQGSYSSLSNTLSQLASGDLQRDSASARRQLENAQDQLVLGAENLYIAILDLQQTRATLKRNEEALGRTLEEMELRYKLGQVSALSLEQAKNGKATLESNLGTVEMNLRRCKLQLQAMIGSSLNGSLVLGELPELSRSLLESIDYEEDLKQAKEKSYDLYAARKKLTEASDTYDEARGSYSRDSYNLRSARHTYESAQYEYKYTVQSFEMSFRNACDAVSDYRHILSAAETSLACQESTYASMELKYRQGTISHNALLEAKDKLSEAKDAVTSAKRNLFTAYRSYYWAINYGVMNSGS